MPLFQEKRYREIMKGLNSRFGGTSADSVITTLMEVLKGMRFNSNEIDFVRYLNMVEALFEIINADKEHLTESMMFFHLKEGVCNGNNPMKNLYESMDNVLDAITYPAYVDKLNHKWMQYVNKKNQNEIANQHDLATAARINRRGNVVNSVDDQTNGNNYNHNYNHNNGGRGNFGGRSNYGGRDNFRGRGGGRFGSGRGNFRNQGYYGPNTTSNQSRDPCTHCGSTGHNSASCATRNNNRINAVNDGGRVPPAPASNVTLAGAFQQRYPRPNGGRGSGANGGN